jgi:hypothetical protein
MMEVFLDMLLIEEIPHVNATGSGLVGLAGKEISARTEKAVGKPPTGKVIACGSRFPMSGLWIDMPYKPGDIVSTNEFGRNYEISLNDGRRYRPGVPNFYLIRYADVEGRLERASNPNAAYDERPSGVYVS